MDVRDIGAVGPTSAERVRSVLASASSFSVATDGRRYELMDPYQCDEWGRLMLDLRADCPLAAQAAHAPRGALAAVLEVTDVAPTAVRDRVRARVALAGWLTEAGPAPAETRVALRLDPAHVTLETAAGTVAVGLGELALAQADPLAAGEAELLTHLADAHGGSVAQLARLVDPRLLHGVIHVWPLALDRYGITLRLEHASSHHDARLPFPRPLRQAAEVGGQIQALLAASRRCSWHRRLHARP